jgi:hypothetical protein
MRKELYKFRYPVRGNSDIEYSGEVIFGVNGVLARILEPQERVKLLFVVARGGADQGFENARLFREEFGQVTAGKEIRVIEEIVEANNEPVKGELDKLTNGLIRAVGENAEIIADFTFGGKPFPFALLCAVNFAEMFKGASLLYLLYSSLNWAAMPPADPVIYDITAVYYLQKLIGAMEGQKPQTAGKMLEDFFAL